MDELTFFGTLADFWEAVLVALVCGGMLAYLGVWVSIKKVFWVPLALSQVAAFGAVLTFFVHDLFDLHSPGAEVWLRVLDPAWLSFVAAVLSALFFARPRLGGQRGVAVAYLLSSAGVLLLGAFVRRDLHDVNAILYGQAVLASLSEVLSVAGAALFALAVHALFYRRFLFVSFDPAAAGAAGFSVFALEVLLYATFAVMLSAATRAMGALPAFGLTVLPALAGLAAGRSLAGAMVLAVCAGLLSAAFGTSLSFHFEELPAGASMAAVAGVLAGAAYLFRWLRT